MLYKTTLAAALALAAAENPTNCKSPKAAGQCYGLGEYTVGTPVLESKCPQLNLTTYNKTSKQHEPTGVLERKCMLNKKVTWGQGCYAVQTAVWEPKQITGIGLNGYWTDYDTSVSDEKYGWIDGLIPDQEPAATSPDLVQGAEVLCRSAAITGASTFPAGTAPCDAAANPDGCWMQGQLVDKSPSNTWVCKLTDPTRKLMAFTPVHNIRALCFAKSVDPSTGSQCSFTDPKCDTCAPYCSIAIPKAGYECPQKVALNDKVLKYDRSAASDKLFHPGLVTGMYFKDPADLKANKNLQYQVDGKPMSPVWGPQPSSSAYILPFTPAANITTKSFGQYVLCPDPPGMPSGQTFRAGTIFNTPMQTTATDNKYHVYTCDNDMLDPTQSLKCLPAEMLTMCWPTGL